MSSGPTTQLVRNLYLLPFAAVAALGGMVLSGWWLGQMAWVQPRVDELALPANAAFCFLALGLAPLIAAWKPGRVALSIAAVGALLAAVGLLDGLMGDPLGVGDLLVRHSELATGPHAGRLPPALGALLLASGLLLVWVMSQHRHQHRPLLLALAGSIAAAYGFTAILAGRLGLAQIEEWQRLAHIGPQAALALQVFGAALILLAAREASSTSGSASPRWLWLPVVVAGSTVTLLFWVSLREREITYINTTTQLTINNIAAVFSGDTETQINTLRRMAERWTESGGIPLQSWERDARAVSNDFPAYRAVSWVDGNLRTRWLWPQAGNEHAAALDHMRHPLRAQAMQQARDTFTYAIAAPLVSPVERPALAVYATVLNGGTFDGFIVGELGFQRLFEIIDNRLNISSRYVLEARITNSLASTPAERELVIFTSTESELSFDERLRQTAVFNLMGQRITIGLTPRREFIAPNRQFLPELALASGLGVSFLLGLVVNLAHSARLRQAAAESTSAQLRSENEERRRVEAQLKVADERLNLALDATQMGVVEWDLGDSRAIYSAGFWNSLGHGSTFMAATIDALLELVHPDDLTNFRQALTAHVAGHTDLIEAEFRIRHQSGSWHWFALRAKCVGTDRLGRPRRVAGTCQNITSRKRSEEALRASQAAERKLSLVASRTDNAVVITRADGRIEWINDSFSRLTGHPLGEVGGRPFVELLSNPESDPGAVERVAAAIAREEAVTIDVTHHPASGRRYHVHLDLQPVKNEEGKVENFIIIETDITSRVEVEKQLRRAKAEADSASRAKSEFLASMSHEIRTPMNGVIGMTSLLNETALTPEQRDYVQTIRTSGDALLSIINEILDFSKIESGRMELERHPFELSQCIEETIDMFALQAAAKGIELAYTVEPAVPPWIIGDITRLRQVLVNLVNNAVKFTPQGFITIEINIAARENDGGRSLLLDFIITDTGIGIPADRQSALFKPFSQVDSSTTRKYGGTGLGLAICDRLAQLMGGSIDVQSELGKGSRFRFSIRTEAATAPGAEPVPHLTGTVLAVDDHPVNRRTLEQSLRAWGCRPIIADSTAGALSQPLDGLTLAIVDTDLAGESGDALVGELRQRFPNLPVIVFTAASESVRQGQSTEPFIYRLPKPIKPAILADCIGRVLRGATIPAAPAPVRPSGPALGEEIPLDILLVEDNPVNQKVALHLLSRLGYRADAVGNGLEAVNAVEQRDYDLLFMDVQMPEMDGFAATREIRTRLPADRQPKIVALTANAIQGDRERCLASGMDDYIAKPVKIEELQRVVIRYFRV